MSSKATPQPKPGTTPATIQTKPVVAPARPFADPLETVDPEASGAEVLQAAAEPPPPPEDQLRRSMELGHHFGRVGVSQPTLVQAKPEPGLLQRALDYPGDYTDSGIQTKPLAGTTPAIAPRIQREEDEEPDTDLESDTDLEADTDPSPEPEQTTPPPQIQPETNPTPEPEPSEPTAEAVEIETEDEADDTIQAKFQAQSPGQNPASRHFQIPVQMQLMVGAPGDRYEQEADQMAARVMAMPDPASPPVSPESTTPSPQIQTKPLAARITPIGRFRSQTRIARQATPGAFTASEGIETQLKSSKGNGTPLPDTTRQFMESRFGNSFESVKVHTDATAVQMNKELHAQAFTHGSDIYFNAGKYDPGSGAGKQLLAHELTHVVQQTGANPLQTKPIQTKPLHPPSPIPHLPSPTSHPLIQREDQADAEAKANKQKVEDDKAALNQELEQKAKEGGDAAAFVANEAKKSTTDQAGQLKSGVDAEKEKVKQGDPPKPEEATQKLNQLSDQSKDNVKNKADQAAQNAEEEKKKDEQKPTPENNPAALPEGVQPPDASATGQPLTVPSTDPPPVNDSVPTVPAPAPVPEIQPPKAPASPDEDPAFQAALKHTEVLAQEQSVHKPSEAKAKEAQDAAQDPQQQLRNAQATQTGDTASKEPKPFDSATFEATLLEQLGLATPQNLDEAENPDAKMGPVKNALTNQVNQAKTTAGGGLPEAAATPPNPSAESPKVVTPTPPPEQEAGPPPANPLTDDTIATGIVPKPKTDAEIKTPLEQTVQNVTNTFGPIQTKLTVGAPGDRYEQEADRMAERVMTMPEVKANPTPKPPPPVAPTPSAPTQAKTPDTPPATPKPATPESTKPAENQPENKSDQPKPKPTPAPPPEPKSVKPTPPKPPEPPKSQEKPPEPPKSKAPDSKPAEVKTPELKPTDAKEAKTPEPKPEAKPTPPAPPPVQRKSLKTPAFTATRLQMGVYRIQRKTELTAQTIEQPNPDFPLTTEQLSGSLAEVGGKDAIGAMKEVETHAQTGPETYRQQEQAQLTSAKSDATNTTAATGQTMFAERQTQMQNVAGTQQATQQQDEAKRTEISAKIQGIYDRTKGNVSQILGDMDVQINQEFEQGSARARAKFEAYVKQRMTAYKNARYYEKIEWYFPVPHRWGIRMEKVGESWIFRLDRWLRDAFLGLPSEVNKFYEEGKQLYIQEMKLSISKISKIMETGLTAAKAEVDKGKQEVQDYVNQLPEDLKQVGAEAASKVASQFDALEQNIYAKQKQLQESLAKKYQENLNQLDERIKQLQAENEGLLVKIGKFIQTVLKTVIGWILDPLQALLGSWVGDVKKIVFAIIDDPIGFISNLFKGIGQGFENFGKNIVKHLQKAVVTWLFGQLGDLKLPEKFDAQGFLDLLLQILGLTKDYIFSLAEAALGSDVVDIIRTLVEQGVNALSEEAQAFIEGLSTGAKVVFEFFKALIIEGPVGIWNFIKDTIESLKGMLITDLIQMVSIELVIAGIKWLIGMLNPATGLIKIVTLIIDVVRFFIANAEQIKQLVATILGAIDAIIQGKVSVMAAAVEQVLADLLPLAIGFLATIIGIGGIASKIRKLFEKLRAPVDKTIGKFFEKVSKFFEGGVKRGKKKLKKGKKSKTKNKDKDKSGTKKKKQDEDEKDKKKKDKEKKDAENAKPRLSSAASAIASDARSLRDPEKVEKNLPSIKSKNKLDTLTIKKQKKKYTIKGSVKKPKKSGVKTVQRQLMPGVIQLKKDEESPWENKENELVVKKDVKAKATSGKLTVKVKVMPQKKVLKKVAEKLSVIIKETPDSKEVKPHLKRLKKEYNLKSIGLFSTSRDGSQYQIEAIASTNETDGKAQRQPASSATIMRSVEPEVEAAIQRSQGRGQSLANPVREPMQTAFGGFNFGQVRIHADAEGDRISRSLQAKAVTVNQDIFFRQGHYAPQQKEGKKLLAHELTHVVQQSGQQPSIPQSSAQTPAPPSVQPKPTPEPASPHRFFRPIAPAAPAEAIQRTASPLVQRNIALIGALVLSDMNKSGVLSGSGGGGGGKDKPDVDIDKKISGNQLTMDVEVEEEEDDPEKKKEKPVNPEADGLPPSLVGDIVKVIQALVLQNPEADTVEKKLPKVQVAFDLDLLKLVGSATVGTSYTYNIKVKGNPDAKEIETDSQGLLEDLAAMDDKPQETEDTDTHQTAPDKTKNKDQEEESSETAKPPESSAPQDQESEKEEDNSKSDPEAQKAEKNLKQDEQPEPPKPIQQPNQPPQKPGLKDRVKQAAKSAQEATQKAGKAALESTKAVGETAAESGQKALKKAAKKVKKKAKGKLKEKLDPTQQKLKKLKKGLKKGKNKATEGFNKVMSLGVKKPAISTNVQRLDGNTVDLTVRVDFKADSSSSK